MKDLKAVISAEIGNGFFEMGQFLHICRFYIESNIGKQKDESVNDFLENQMKIVESFCASHLKKMKHDLNKVADDWKEKNEGEK